jgi:hypothetical protein
MDSVKKTVNAKLITDLSDKVFENKNGKKSKACTVEIMTKSGIKQATAFMSDKHYNNNIRLDIGSKYICNVNQNEDGSASFSLTPFPVKEDVSFDDI